MTPTEARKIYNTGEEAVVRALCDLGSTIESQRKKVSALEIKIAKLSKNSSNSGKRPSSDDITKPKKEKQNSGEKRRIGGQPGHPRNVRTLFPKEEIDGFKSYVLPHCPECNSEVSITEGKPHILQQMDLIEVPIFKQEHRSYPVWCEKCQKIHYMPFPPEIVREGLFKERLSALVVYMKYVNHASYSTIKKFIRDVLGEQVSSGYVRKIIRKASISLEDPYNELLKRIPLEATVNVDETGHKDNGDKFWTWVFKADLYVLFRIDKSRGSKVLVDVLGKEFNGVLGCDYFSAYHKYMKDFNVSVQFCIAHLIRNIRFLTTLPDAETKAYGEGLLNEIRKLFKTIHGHDSMTQCDFVNALEEAKTNIITFALEDVPSKLDANGKEEKTEARNMADRFRKFGKAYFEFITTPGIGPTNNAAEQAIRFIVIDRHVTQGTRSLDGRKSSERLWTVIATCALQGRSAFNFILESLRAYFHQQTAPSLLLEPG